jgi:hypothetical protein
MIVGWLVLSSALSRDRNDLFKTPPHLIIAFDTSLPPNL